MKPRVAILASGGGTTADVFIRSSLSGEISADVSLVISNHKNPGIFEKVASINREFGLKIKCLHIGKSNFPPADNEEVPYGTQSISEEKAILEELEKNKIDLVMLLGYMKRIGKSIVGKYGWKDSFASIYQARMLNTHPGILPDTKA